MVENLLELQLAIMGLSDSTEGCRAIFAGKETTGKGGRERGGKLFVQREERLFLYSGRQLYEAVATFR